MIFASLLESIDPVVYLALGVYSFIGVLVYSASCFVLWLLAGKPPGLEEKVFRLIRNRLSVMK